MQRAGDDDLVEERLQRHRDAGLQRDGADRQAEARQRRDRGCWSRRPPAAPCRSAIWPRLVSTPVTRPVLDDEAGDLGLGVNLHAPLGGVAGIAPGDGVMAGDGARRMIERAEDRIAHILGHVERRAEPVDLVGIDQLGIDAQMLVHLGAPAAGAHGRIGMGEGEMAAHGIEDVVVEFLAQPLIEPDGFVVEAHALRRQIVRADDGGVARGVAAGEIALVQHRDIGDAPVLGQVIGGGEPMAAGADDDDVVGGLQLRGLGEMALGRVFAAEPVFQESEWHEMFLGAPGRRENRAPIPCRKLQIGFLWSKKFSAKLRSHKGPLARNWARESRLNGVRSPIMSC